MKENQKKIKKNHTISVLEYLYQTLARDRSLYSVDPVTNITRAPVIHT